MLNLLMIFIY